jgi:pimeloyl-ACP methyl ester carboxylesterase
MWREHQVGPFAAAGFRVIAWSRRGWRPSVTTQSEPRGTQVDDMTAVLDARGVASAHVIGAAAGGGVAMRFAAAHPARVASLVLVGTILSPEEEDWRRLYAGLMIARVKDHVPVEFIEIGPSYRATDPDGTRRFAELSAASREAFPAGKAEQPSGFALTFAAMRAIKVPTLLVTGEADLYAPPPMQRLFARHMPHAEQVTMPEIGHAPYWEAPAAFNRLLLDFLARL